MEFGEKSQDIIIRMAAHTRSKMIQIDTPFTEELNKDKEDLALSILKTLKEAEQKADALTKPINSDQQRKWTKEGC